MQFRQLPKYATLALTLLLAACFGDDSPITPASTMFTIGGQLSGLRAGASVTLTDQSHESVSLTANGAFSFAVPVPLNGSYAVTIGAQPTGETCTVTRGGGTGVVADVASIVVTCAASTFKVGGAVTGLPGGARVTLDDNGADPLVVTASGSFKFATPVAYNSGYAVTVGTQPVGETCTVSNARGSGVIMAITSVSVICAVDTYTVSGTVSGLTSGTQLTLNDNGADALTLKANGAFTFTTAVAYNSGYLVTVGTQPIGEICTVSNGAGVGVVANVNGARLICAVDTYTVGGGITGLAGGAQVTLDDNGDDALTLTANGPFSFVTPVAYHGDYAVTVGTQPANQTCAVTSGSGGGVTSDVLGITVTCVTHEYTTGGALSGLTGTVVLQNNGADSLSTSTDGAFAFPVKIAQGAAYAVSVKIQPAGQTCSVANGTGVMGAVPVSNVAVVCSTNAYTVGGSVTGLTGTVSLQDNGSDALIISSDGSFTFATPVAYGSTYAVTVQTGPIAQTCSVGSGTGTIGLGNVASVTVVCSTNTYTVGGTASGLSGTVVVQNNSGDSMTINANGGFTFASPIAEGSTYNVTVQTQPAVQTCSVTNGAGTLGGSDVSNVALNCVTNTTTLSVSATTIVPVDGVSAALTVTNTGANPAVNVVATLPGGWTGVTQDASNCAIVAAGDTCTLAFTSSIPYVAQGTIAVTGDNIASPPTFALAFSMSGYLVFAVPTGSTALVVGASDAATSAWSQGSDNVPGITEQSTVAGGAACDGASDGACDTAQIVARYGAPLSSYAAGDCDGITADNTGAVAVGTWYLPAICELGGAGQDADCAAGVPNIDTNLLQLGFSGLSGYYWSSTEVSYFPTSYTFLESFGGGGSMQYHAAKFYNFGVRCARSMTY